VLAGDFVWHAHEDTDEVFLVLKGEMRVGYRTGDMWAPKLAMTEALRVEGEHFADCIQNKKTPQTDGQLGHRVVRLIEVANSSMRRMGETVFIHREVKA